METTTDTPIPSPRRLFRARDSRYLGGVCAGLGRYFDLSPAIYRIAFVALALAGGTGVLLYLAAWAVMPEEGAEDSWASDVLRRHRDRPARLIGLGVIAFAIVLALSEARFWPSPGNLWLAFVLLVVGVAWWQISERRPVSSVEKAPSEPVERRRGLVPAALGAALVAAGVAGLLQATGATDVDWRIVLAALVVLTGGLVVVGVVAGRSVAGVALLGLALLAALGLGLAVRVPLFSGIGNRDIEPASLTSVQSKYELGIGNFHLDLSNVPFPVGETHVKATVGIGELLVRVPRNVTVDVDGRAQGGDVLLLGHDQNGMHVSQQLVDRTGSGRVLVLDARVGFGQVRVERTGA